MKTLYLLRHAKSSWKDAGLTDMDRPLKKRGRLQADALSDHFSSLLPPPERVLCSPARRTVETLSYFLEVWPLAEENISMPSEAYLADSAVWLSCLQQLPAEVEVAMLVGHNPGITDLLNDLDPTTREHSSHLRTCEFVQMDFDVDTWDRLNPGTGSLKLRIRPKDLDS